MAAVEPLEPASRSFTFTVKATVSLDAGVKVTMGITGHVSRAMLSRYSHVRMEAKRRALDEIATRQNTADEKRKDDSERREQAAAVFQSAVVSNRRRGNVGRRLPEKGVQACPSAQFPRGAP